jgi:acetyl-CoA synthetase
VVESATCPCPGTTAEIRDFARQRLGAISYPRQVEFVDELPLTTSGKIRRGALRDREAERRRGA